MQKYPYWKTTVFYFETKAKLPELKQFVNYLFSHYFKTEDKLHKKYGHQCPIFDAITWGGNGHFDFLEFMIDHSPFDFNVTWSWTMTMPRSRRTLYYTPILWASKRGNASVVALLIENSKYLSIDLNAGIENIEAKPANSTPLLAACFSGNVDTVRAFLDNAIEYGIRLVAWIIHRVLPLHAAIILNYHFRRSEYSKRKRRQRLEIIELLLTHPVAKAQTNYNARCGYKQMTALHLACHFRLPKVVELLVSHAANLQIDLFARDANEMTAMDLALENEDMETCSKFEAKTMLQNYRNLNE